MRSICRIVAAGDFAPERYLAYDEREPAGLLIAADAGYFHLKKLGFLPDLFVGDADSLGFRPTDTQCVMLPTQKDDTDTLSAVREGLKRGFTDFELFGALGGRRFSHSLANLQTLLFLKKQGASGCIVDADCTVRVLQNERVPVGDTAYFSVFAATETATVSIFGAKYPVEGQILSADFPLGTSNEPRGEAVVTAENGIVFLVTEP